ncbi:MAG: hypothetical protein JNK05_03995 [Myxococcales bacterium]|nr:hypothetical protein [Myxococcales bacterium]
MNRTWLHSALLAASASACDTAVRLGNTSPNAGASSGASASGPRCEYTVDESPAESERVSTVRADQVRRWLVDSSASDSDPCAARLARVVVEFADGEAIPSENELRTALRDVVRAPSNSADSLAWDIQHDGHPIRAHILATQLARRGWNVHKLFVLGDLAPRDVDQRFLRRGGMVFDGQTTPDGREARRWSWHVAPVVLVRVDGRAGQSFACPDDRDQRCALRVLDPSVRAGRASATTDDAMGLFHLRDWLRALRPQDSDARRGLALEFARRLQFLPRSLLRGPSTSELVVTESEQCPIGTDALAQRRTALRASLHGDARAQYRAVVALNPQRESAPATVELEGINEALVVRDPTLVASLEQARSSGSLATVTYDDATSEVRAVRVESSTAPSVCLRAAISLGD